MMYCDVVWYDVCAVLCVVRVVLICSCSLCVIKCTLLHGVFMCVFVIVCAKLTH